MEDESWLAEKLAKLGIEDSDVLANYVNGILESSGGDVSAAGQVLEGYVSNSTQLGGFLEELSARWKNAKKKKEEQLLPAAGSAAEILKSKWSLVKLVEDVNKTVVVKSDPHRLDKAERELTLRLAQQIQDQQIQQEMNEALQQQQANDDEEKEESAAQKNRTLVQTKIQQAQKVKEDSIRKHKEESKAASASDRKDKAQRKEERQKRAQKGERRGNS